MATRPHREDGPTGAIKRHRRPADHRDDEDARRPDPLLRIDACFARAPTRRSPAGGRGRSAWAAVRGRVVDRRRRREDNQRAPEGWGQVLGTRWGKLRDPAGVWGAEPGRRRRSGTVKMRQNACLDRAAIFVVSSRRRRRKVPRALERVLGSLPSFGRQSIASVGCPSHLTGGETCRVARHRATVGDSGVAVC
jgi:hypothetical protein